MLELAIVLFAGGFVLYVSRTLPKKDKVLSGSTKQKLQKLWDIAQDAMRSRKYLPAQKALLTILQIDHKNASAYNRLGILYAKQEQFKDAIECFEIASSIDPTPSSLHNLGLVYFENEKYEKAAIALSQAIEKEPLAVRYIAYAKVMNKMNNRKEVIGSLEKAVELETNPQTLNLLIEAYENDKNFVAAEEARSKLLVIKAKSNPSNKASDNQNKELNKKSTPRPSGSQARQKIARQAPTLRHRRPKKTPTTK